MWTFDPATDRFYGWLCYDSTYGNLVIGNNTLSPPTSFMLGATVLGAFNRQGQNIWVRQASTNKFSNISDLTFGKDGTLYIWGGADPGSIFCGDTAKNTSAQTQATYIMALDTNANLLWANHSANSQFLPSPFAFDIGQVNNTVVIAGQYLGTLSWNNLTVTNTGQSFNTYILRADAATGKAKQLFNINSGSTFNPYSIALDKNGDMYMSGAFAGNLVFASDNLSSHPLPSSHNSFLLKYKNVVCNCDLLQPSFTSTGATATYQFTYTGQTPYSSISWDFGDGSPSVSSPNPSHTYASLGTYPVCVTVTNSCGSNTTCTHITVNTTAVQDADGAFSSVSVYPNPAKNEVMISNLAPGTNVEILDVLGRRLKTVRSGNAVLHINVEELNAGVHILRFTDKEGRCGSRVLLKE